MKGLIKNLCFFSFNIINIFFSYEYHKRYFLIFIRLRSFWISSNFRKCGSATFGSPVYIKGSKYISIGKRFSSEPGLRIEAWDRYLNNCYKPEIIIGDNVSFSYNCHVGAIKRIIIHDNVLIGSNVFITDHSHGSSNQYELNIPPSKRNLYSKGEVIIESNVWIGENVSILPGVTIGCNSIIGANSVVTKNIPQNVIAAGIPAKVVKQYATQLHSKE